MNRVIPIRALVVLSTFFAAVPAHAAGALDSAHRLEAAGDHAGAIRTYEGALAEHGFSPELLYDLGSAQLAAGEVGPAVASLQRARVLAPRDAQIRAALDGARARAGLAPAARPVYERAAELLSPREWAFSGVGAAAVVALAVLALALRPRRRRWASAGLAAGLVIATGAFAGSALAARALDGGIVVADGAIVRRSPFAQADAVATLPAGEAVATREQHGGYTYVETGTGARGWVETGAVTLLAAEAPPTPGTP